MYQISEPFLRFLGVDGVVVGVVVRGHVERPLPEEGLRVGRHVAQVVHHDEHLDDGAQRIEEGHLNGAPLRHAVSLLAKVDVACRDRKSILSCPPKNRKGKYAPR